MGWVRALTVLERNYLQQRRSQERRIIGHRQREIGFNTIDNRRDVNRSGVRSVNNDRHSVFVRSTERQPCE